ncbi:MAG: tetratricopeptide repeat protein [Verrucomicrobia bacterium]|nr:tetratricopeptide repeat protein [Verrucomicrobiota bacterium]
MILPWVKKFLLALLVPLGLLAGLEGVCRLVDVGYSPDFFLPEQLDGRPVWIENEQFGRRFFARELVRLPEPICLDREKASNAFRIVVLGGSTAEGDPDSSYGFARMLELYLEAALPHRKVEVVNAAMTAINSHVVREIARDSLRIKPDAVILYLGHNEVVGPLGPGTVFLPFEQSTWLPRLKILGTRFRLVQGLMEQIQHRTNPRKTWRGMEMFTGRTVAEKDPRLDAVVDSFKANLNAILQSYQREGIPVLLCGLTVNHAGLPPFSSISGIPEGPDRQVWSNRLDAIIASWSKADPIALRSELEETAAADPGYAMTHYLLGRLALHEGRSDRAVADLDRAVDLDGLRFRADSRLRQVLHDTAQTMHVPLCDVDDLLRGGQPHTVTSPLWFYDHVHFRMEANRAITEALARWVLDLPRLQETPGSPVNWDRSVVPGLGLTDWDQWRVEAVNLRRLMRPPFSGLLDHPDAPVFELALERLEALAPHTGPQGVAQAAQAYRDAIEIRPGDLTLQLNYGSFLLASSRYQEAIVHYREALRLAPWRSSTRMSLAVTVASMGRLDEAVQILIDQRSALPLTEGEAYRILGVQLSRPGRLDLARQLLERADRLSPDHPEVHNQLGMIDLMSQAYDRARGEFELAVKLDPSMAIGWSNLGVLEMEVGNLDPALEWLDRALTIDSDQAEVWHNRARLLRLLQKPKEAEESYQRALNLQQGLRDSLLGYTDLLVSEGRLPEALQVARRGVRLHPMDAAMHANVGKLWIEAQRPAQAETSLRRAMELDPGDEQVRALLDALTARAP